MFEVGKAEQIADRLMERHEAMETRGSKPELSMLPDVHWMLGFAGSEGEDRLRRVADESIATLVVSLTERSMSEAIVFVRTASEELSTIAMSSSGITVFEDLSRIARAIAIRDLSSKDTKQSELLELARLSARAAELLHLSYSDMGVLDE